MPDTDIERVYYKRSGATSKPALCPPRCHWEQKTKFQVDQFKLGLNYKF